MGGIHDTRVVEHEVAQRGIAITTRDGWHRVAHLQVRRHDAQFKLSWAPSIMRALFGKKTQPLGELGVQVGWERISALRQGRNENEYRQVRFANVQSRERCLSLRIGQAGLRSIPHHFGEFEVTTGTVPARLFTGALFTHVHGAASGTDFDVVESSDVAL